MALKVLDFTTGQLPSGVTLTRATTGYVAENGLLVEKGIDVPRFETEEDGTISGLLYEGLSTEIVADNTNLSIFSESGFTSIVNNVEISPLGDLTADQLLPLVTTNPNRSNLIFKDDVSFTLSQDYTIRMFAKQGGYNCAVAFFAGNNDFSSVFQSLMSYDLFRTANTYYDGTLEGTLIPDGNSPDSSLLAITGSAAIESKIKNIGGGWKECFNVFNSGSENFLQRIAIATTLENYFSIDVSGIHGEFVDGIKHVKLFSINVREGNDKSSFLPSNTTRQPDIITITDSEFGVIDPTPVNALLSEENTIVIRRIGYDAGGIAFVNVFKQQTDRAGIVIEFDILDD